MNPSPLQNLQSHPEVKAYLSRLKKHLNPLTSEQKVEIHQEIENRIYEELALGSSMASNKEAVLHLLQRMGEPETLAKELKLEYLQGTLENQSLRVHHQAFWRRALRPMLYTLGAITALLLLRNIVLIFQSSITLGTQDMVLEMIRFVPELLILGIPLALSLGCALYVHHVISTDSAPRFQDRAKMWAVVILLGVLGSGLSVWNYQQVVKPLESAHQQRIQQTMSAQSEVHAGQEIRYQPSEFARQFKAQKQYAFASANLTFALWGGVAGLLMATGIVGLFPGLIGFGTLLPAVLWYSLFSSFEASSHFIVPSAGFPAVMGYLAYLPTLTLLLITACIGGFHLMSAAHSQTET